MSKKLAIGLSIIVLSFLIGALLCQYGVLNVQAQGSVTAQASTIVVVPPAGITPTPDTGPANVPPAGLTPTVDTGTVVIQSTPNPTDEPEKEDDTYIEVTMIGCPGVNGAQVVFTRDGVTVVGDISTNDATRLDVPFGGEWEAIINGETVGTVFGNDEPMIIQAGSTLCPPFAVATPAYVPDTGSKFNPTWIFVIFNLLLILTLIIGGLRSDNNVYTNITKRRQP